MDQHVHSVDAVEHELFDAEMLDERIEFADWKIKGGCEAQVGPGSSPPKCEVLGGHPNPATSGHLKTGHHG
jgi:hypothetical protein